MRTPTYRQANNRTVWTTWQDEGALTLAGVDVPSLQVVGIKSSTHFRGGWAPVARKIVTADEPGFSSNVLATFEPLRTKAVIRWPTDERAVYEQLEEAVAAAARL